MVPFAALILIAIALVPSALLSADPVTSLVDLPVAGTVTVAPDRYEPATAAAARGADPLAIALHIVGPFEGATQHIVQVNQGAEAPSAVRLTVVRDGLLDDSVRGERWDIVLEKTADGVWRIKQVRQSWRCRRDTQADRFATTPCP
jgi:hypothetical protein